MGNLNLTRVSMRTWLKAQKKIAGKWNSKLIEQFSNKQIKKIASWMWFFDSETHVSMFGTIRKQFYCALFANALDFWEKHLLAKCDIFKVFFYIKFSCNNISNFLHFSIRSQCYNEFIRSRVVIHMILLDCFKLLLLFLL